MGCYGIGVSRIVAAAIEQNFDAAGIIWPDADGAVAGCRVRHQSEEAMPRSRPPPKRCMTSLNANAASTSCLDDRGLRPGGMFADMELIGMPHRVVVSERGLAAGTYEYRGRRDAESVNLDREGLFAKLR